MGGHPLCETGKIDAILAVQEDHHCSHLHLAKARQGSKAGSEIGCIGGTSDGRFIAQICPQVMEFGVINESIHKLDEWVDVAALAPLTAVYRRTLERFLATPAA